jgi:hypothetical protein
VGWVKDKLFWLSRSCFADEFAGSKTSKGFEALGEVAGLDEVVEVVDELGAITPRQNSQAF